MVNKTRSEKKLIAASQSYLERDYWLTKLVGDLDISTFPHDIVNSDLHERKMEKVNHIFSPELNGKLMKLANNSDYRLHMILLAGLTVLINKYTGNKDIIIGSPVYKQDMEGEFINTVLVLRNILSEEMTFKEVLLQVRDTVADATKHQNYPLETLLYQLGIEEKSSSLFEIALMVENIHEWSYLDGINYNLLFVCTREGGEIQVTLEYNAFFYHKDTIERVLNHYHHLFMNLLANIDTAIKEVNLLSNEERKQILFDFNHDSTDFPADQTIYQMIENHAERTPQKIAVRCADQSMTYWELNEKANQLARFLRKKGVAPDQPVGILCKRGLEMIVGILAVFKAGGAYVPIDGNYPVERIKTIVSDSETTVLLTTSHASSQVDHFLQEIGSVIDVQNIIYLDEVFSSPFELSEINSRENLERINTLSNLCYVIYTSGSTGKPKGAMVEHIGMLNHINAKIKDLNITDSSIISQNSSHCFDISVWQFFAALAVGGQTVIYPDELVLEPEQFITQVSIDQITILEVVPSYLSAILDTLDRVPKSLDQLKYLLVTGEVVKPKLMQRWFEKYPQIPVVNAYGPTEASDDITHYIMDKFTDEGSIPIGKPLPNFNIYIVDEFMNLCPVGVRGEICVSGIGVGRGYIHDEERTNKVFLVDPFIGEGTRRLYKTGDIGQWREDGNIIFFGRKDYQVKIRGYRIEIGEIENILSLHPDIREVVVIDREDTEANKYLCAYIVSDKEINPSQIREYLALELPEYMIPGYFIPLTEIPLTANGKINRKALPEPTMSYGYNDQESPKNELERRLAVIWGDILGVEKLGTNENFFEIGGHSLKVTTMLAKIHKEFDVKISLEDIFKRPTIKDVAVLIQKAEKQKHISIQRADKREHYPLSSAQKRMFILQEMHRDSTRYNMTYILRIHENLERAKIEMIFTRLLQRHEVFRTSFTIVDDQPVQKIDDTVAFEIDYHDLSQADDCEIQVERITEQFVKPFDLFVAPILRVALVKVKEDVNILLIDTHHIISDGISQEILINEFIELYLGRDLPELRLQYKDYAVWQNEEKQRQNIENQEKYWLEQFSGQIPVLNLPTDFARERNRSFAGDRVSLSLDQKQAQELIKLANDHNATLFMVLLAIYSIFLQKLSGQEDLVIGVPIAGRRHDDLNNIVGMFVNTLALRNKPSNDQTFIQFLQQVRENTVQAFENQDYQFEDLISKLHLRRDPTRNPIFDVVLVLQNQDTQAKTSEEQQVLDKFELVSRSSEIAKFDLVFEVIQREDTLGFNLQYSTELFLQSTIEEIGYCIISMIEQVISKPEQKIAEILLSHHHNQFSLTNRSEELNRKKIVADFDL